MYVSIASLYLTDNTQLRLNSNTELRIIDSATIELISGEIYHDADLAGQIILKEIIPAILAHFDGEIPDDWDPDSFDSIKQYCHLAGWEMVYEECVTNPDSDSPT